MKIQRPIIVFVIPEMGHGNLLLPNHHGTIPSEHPMYGGLVAALWREPKKVGVLPESFLLLFEWLNNFR